MSMINLEISKKEIIYDGKVKKYGKKGVIPIKEKLDQKYVYVIFPFERKDIGGKVHILVDSMYREKVCINEGKYQINLINKYAGKKCIVINAKEEINMELKKRHSVYDGKVKKTHNGQGIVRVKDKYLGSRSYVIFPSHRKEDDNMISFGIDEISNEGIHPDTDHTCRILLGREYVGRDCLIVLQEA